LAVVLIVAGLLGTLRLTAVPFTWQPFTPESFATARKSDQIVLVEFTASWCLNCKYIEQTVYHDPQTLEELRKHNVITLKADLTDYSAPGWALLNELGGTGIPFTAIYPATGDKPLTLESIYTTDTLLKTVNHASNPMLTMR
jgi:thiol:disulfide interchange protein DsbD